MPDAEAGDADGLEPASAVEFPLGLPAGLSSTAADDEGLARDIFTLDRKDEC